MALFSSMLRSRYLLRFHKCASKISRSRRDLGMLPIAPPSTQANTGIFAKFKWLLMIFFRKCFSFIITCMSLMQYSCSKTRPCWFTMLAYRASTKITRSLVLCLIEHFHLGRTNFRFFITTVSHKEFAAACLTS